MLRQESWYRDHDPFLDQCSPCLSKGIGVCQDMLVGWCKEWGAEDLSINRLGKSIQQYGACFPKTQSASFPCVTDKFQLSRFQVVVDEPLVDSYVYTFIYLWSRNPRTQT